MVSKIILITCLIIFAALYFSTYLKKERNLSDYNPGVSFSLVSSGALLLDVRSPREYASGHIKEAVNIPYDELEAKMSIVDGLLKNKDKSIVVYCQSGRRSEIAKKTLKKFGYTKVVNHGGIGSWKKK
jgi:phage shock protein E